MEHQHQLRSVLVTGGSGFIGSNFLLRLVPKYPEARFINLDSLSYAGNPMNLREIESLPNYSFVQGDICDRELLLSIFEESQVNTLVHFAAESHVDRSILDPLSFVRTNVMGTATLLDVARRSWEGNPEGNRFYHVSTDEVFGSLGKEGFFEESTPYDPRSPYSASKASSDHLVRAYNHTFGLPIVISNCTNNYGPYQFPEKLIPLMIQNAVSGKPLPVYGDGSNVRDWLYVEDHCSAIESILVSGKDGLTYGVGGDCEKTNLEIVHLIADLVDAELGREAGTTRENITFVTDRPGHDFRYAMDCSFLKKELSWKAETSFEDGLKKTISWYLSNDEWLEAINNESYREYYTKQYSDLN